ncbi:hypothetical protein DFQ28_004694 [Apophysomyces sp. BC1034]|nr:hypothetical protein DFQ30_005511 [Apophysomyces sp. BC1015]KAG0178963.1 hypothetical protein DFQ29_002758 [Apophysomyces sp. BC1021]KAG0188567.1 hypothetical protein DFQ28_004694 [Apophysomyces sp. BC1034]
MTFATKLADVAQKSVVLLLAGTTVYYVANIGTLVNQRLHLKKEGKLQEELARLHELAESRNINDNGLHAETATTPTPIPDTEQPGNMSVE